jgi:hypothetical protein
MAQLSLHIKKTPHFDGINYAYWKVKMTAHLKSINREVWKVTETKFKVVNLEAPTPMEEKKLQCNDTAISSLHVALYDKTFEQVKNIEIAHDAWAKLEETYKGTEGTMSVLRPWRALSRRVNLCCMFPTPDGDAQGFILVWAKEGPTSSGKRRVLYFLAPKCLCRGYKP